MEVLKIPKIDSNFLPTITEAEFPDYIYSEELPENRVLVEIFRQGIHQ